MDPVVAVRGLICPVACEILVPRPGIEPSSTALEGGFLTTGPPGKSPCDCFCVGSLQVSLGIVFHFIQFPLITEELFREDWLILLHVSSLFLGKLSTP